jgi:hypothetical protein
MTSFPSEDNVQAVRQIKDLTRTTTISAISAKTNSCNCPSQRRLV